MGWHYAYGPMMGGYGNYGIADMVISVVWAVILLVVAVSAIRFLLGRGGRHARPWMSERDTPLDILKERYAKGEIDKAEFEEKKRDLA